MQRHLNVFTKDKGFSSFRVENVRCLSDDIIWYLGQFLVLIGHFGLTKNVTISDDIVLISDTSEGLQRHQNALIVFTTGKGFVT